MAVGGKDACELNGRSGCSGRLLAERKAAGEPIASRCAGFHESMPNVRYPIPLKEMQNEKEFRERGA
jgi:hypothetical protein